MSVARRAHAQGIASPFARVTVPRAGNARRAADVACVVVLGGFAILCLALDDAVRWVKRRLAR